MNATTVSKIQLTKTNTSIIVPSPVLAKEHPVPRLRLVCLFRARILLTVRYGIYRFILSAT